MAYDASISAPYSGRPAFNVYLYVRRDQTDVANNRSSYAWALYARNPAGSSQTFALDCYSWSVAVAGQTFNGCHDLDFRGGQTQIVLGSGTTGWVPHDANGNLNIIIDCYHGPAGVFGTADPNYIWFATDRIAQVPARPAPPTVSAITTQGMKLSWTIPDNRGAAIDQMLLRRYNTSDVSGSDYVDYPNAGNSTSRTVTGLDPASTYYWVVYAHNAVGFSPQSGKTPGTTLPSTPPGITVVPSLSGTSAVATMTPPSGSSGVTSYDVEYRIGSSGTVNSKSGESPMSVTQLTPGKTYQWRARASYGEVKSPWSNWVSYFQPNPNVTPGQYFDGSSTDTVDIDFQWAGTVNNSVTNAVGKKVTGWRDFATAAFSSGGSGCMFRVTGAIGRHPNGEPAGSYSARYVFFKDATGPQFRAGTENSAAGRAAVSEGGIYYGEIAARPSKTQRLVAEITFVATSDGQVVRKVGTTQLVQAGTTAVLQVSAQAPFDGTATVEVMDTGGTGWSLWRGGDFITVDAAILTVGAPFPFFDGSTPDTFEYDYAWLGATQASVSTRTTIDFATTDPLADPDCPSPPSPPTPPVITDDCITENGVWRRYWVQVPAVEVAQWMATIPTLELTTGAQAAREVRVRYYVNPDNTPPQEFTPGDFVAEQIVRYMPPRTVLSLDGVSERARASVNGSDWVAADHLLYGSGGGPATWPLLACGTGYLISLDVPLDANLGNLSTDLSLTRRML